MTGLERGLAGLWASVLGRAEVGVTESFAALGGDRAAAVELTAFVREAFGVNVDPASLFGDVATVRDMAVLVGAGRTPGIARRPSGPAPLSSGQQRLWVMDQLVDNSPFYNVPIAYWLHGEVDVAALGRALGRLAARHELLRARIDAPDGVPVQVVGHETIGDLEVRDAPGTPQDVLALATEYARRRFDLATGPLARALLLRAGPEVALLVLAVHHIAMDGWSKEIVVRELSEFYRAELLGRLAEVEPLPITYADYAAWQQDWLRSARYRRELDWWRAELAGVPTVLPLPIDHPRPEMPGYLGAAIPFTVAPAVADALRDLAKRHGVTLFTVLLTAVCALLAAECGVTDVVVGVPSSGRSRPEVHGLVGFFINTLAVHADCGGSPTFVELLDRVRAATLAAYAHQDVPFDRVVRELDRDRDGSRNPVAQVLVQIEAEDPVPDLPGVVASHVDNLDGGVRADLEIHFHDDFSSLRGQLVYATDLFEPATGRRLTDQLSLALEAVSDGAKG